MRLTFRMSRLWARLRRPHCDHDWHPDFWGMVEIPGQAPIYGVIDVCTKCPETLVRFP